MREILRAIDMGKFWIPFQRGHVLAVLNTWLNTPLRRSLFVVAVAFLLLWVLSLAAGTVWMQKILAFIIAVVAVVQGVRFWRNWNDLRTRVQRWEMRIVRSWREFSRPSPFVQSMQVLAFALGLLWVAIHIGFQTNLMPIAWLALFALGIAGVSEMTVQARRLLSKAWAPFLGKIFAVSLGVALAALATSNAKQLVHALSPIDPKYMTELTVILAAAYLPVIYLATAGVAMAAYAIFQVLIFWVVSAAGMLANYSKLFLGGARDAQLRLYWYRIRMGKRPCGGVLPAATFLSPSDVSLLASPVSKVLVAAILVGAVQEASQQLPLAMPFLKRAMVELEYREKSACKDVPKGARVVYMDDGKISIAEAKDDGYSFRVAECKYEE